MNTKISLPLAAGLSAVSLMGFGCTNPIDSMKQSVENKVGNVAANAAVGAITGGKVQVDSDNKNWVYKDNKTGNTIAIGDNVKIPDDFPKEVPIYPGSKAMSVSEDKQNDSQDALVLQTTDNVSQVVKWYEDQAKSANWTEDQNSTMGSAEMREYSKDSAQLSVLITPGDGNTGATVTMSYKPKPKVQ